MRPFGRPSRGVLMRTRRSRFVAGFTGFVVLNLLVFSLLNVALASAGEGSRPSPAATPGSGSGPGQSGEQHGQGHAHGNGNPNGRDEDGDGQVDERGEQGHVDTHSAGAPTGAPPIGDPSRGIAKFGTLTPCQPRCMPANTWTPPCDTTTTTNPNNASVHFFYAHYSDEVSNYAEVVGLDNSQGLAEVVDRINYAIYHSEPPNYRERIVTHCTIGGAAGQSALPVDRITQVTLSTNSTPGCDAFSFCAMVRDLSELGYNKPNKAYFVFLDTARGGGNGMGSQAHVCNWWGAGPCYGVATQAWRSVAQHEFVHLLGAPHTTGECTGSGDPSDVMWYWWDWWRVDAGGDDYYNTWNMWSPDFHCGYHNGWSIGGWNIVRSQWATSWMEASDPY